MLQPDGCRPADGVHMHRNGCTAPTRNGSSLRTRRAARAVKITTQNERSFGFSVEHVYRTGPETVTG